MRKREKKSGRLEATKRKLTAALCMLLVSTILMTTVSYAWLILSIAPEVTGITTNVGANGALEIALLNGETRQDMSLIRSGVGESLAGRNGEANYSWGNLLDLSYDNFGLGQITLMPARIDLKEKDGGYSVNSGMLLAPTYGYDGRIVDVTGEVFGATYNTSSGTFSYDGSKLDYGVRALGTADSMSVQAAALVLARSNISTYNSNAASTVRNSLATNGPDLITLLMNKDSTHDDEDLAMLQTMINDLDTALTYIEDAIRYGFIAYAASQIADETTFEAVRSRVLAATDLATLLDETEVSAPPAELGLWIEKLKNAQNNVAQAQTKLAELSGGAYSWEQIRPVMDPLINVNYVYIDDTLFGDFDMSNASSLMTNGAKLTLAPGSGVYAQVADFTGNYSTIINFGPGIDIATASAVNPAYLAALATGAAGLEAAGSNGGGSTKADLTTTYGYALDLAFRTNAAVSDLLLQTDAAQRVYSDSASGATQGGGSYMQFSTKDSTMSATKMIQLMDAIRVAFVDDQYNVLGIAKLNTSNRTTEDGVIKAPLYLYEYSVAEDSSLVMGMRQKTGNKLTALEQNVAKAISVLVWIDGDIVDNTMVSGDEETSLNGVLNLQFASSADLVPAGNSDLKNISADKSELGALVSAVQTTYENGQKFTDPETGVTTWYTTVSWNTFADAYKYADEVNQDFVATELQVYYASRDLAYAFDGLTQVSHAALQTSIDEVREAVGTTTERACYVGYDKETDSYFTFDEYTMDEYRSVIVEDEDGEAVMIYRVDYTENLMDSGDGVLTQIYSDASWSALAEALYRAEAVNLYEDSSEEDMDEAIAALNYAYDALDRQVFFFPYDYEGDLYYKAIYELSNTDTYGVWYDAEFDLVTSDLTILNLDAYAEEVEIATVELAEYVTYYADHTTAYVDLLDEYYPELTNEEIVALTWTLGDNDPALFEKGITSAHLKVLQSLLSEADYLEYWYGDEWGENADPDEENIIPAIDQDAYDAAFNLYCTHITPEEEVEIVEDADVSADHAELVIDTLQAEIDAVYDALNAREASAREGLITDDQRAVLMAAVAAARGVEGYDEAEERLKYEALDAAVKSGEEVLANADATEDMKNAARDAIVNCLNELVWSYDCETLSESVTYAKNLDGYKAYLVDVSYEEKLPELETAVQAVNALLASETVTEAQATTALEGINACLIAVGGEAVAVQVTGEEEEVEPGMMTVAQRNALTTAAANGQSILDAKDWMEKVCVLVPLVEAADDARYGYYTTTEEEATTALDNLNAQLEVLDVKSVTADNTIVYEVPGSDVNHPIYTVEHPSATLIPTGYTGTDTLTFTMMTRNGIVVTLKRNVTVYYPAAGVSISDDLSNTGKIVEWTENPDSEKILVVGEERICNTYLLPHYVDIYTWYTDESGNEYSWSQIKNLGLTESTDDDGNTIFTDEDGNTYMYNYRYAAARSYRSVVEEDKIFSWYTPWDEYVEGIDNGENVWTVTWSTNNTDVLGITTNEDKTCTVLAKGAGNAELSALVKTAQGNSYIQTFNVTVMADDQFYLVTADPGVDGDVLAVVGEDYEFYVDSDYIFMSVAVGGVEIEPEENGNGWYTIPADALTGEVVISAIQAEFNVDLDTGMGGSPTADALENYSFEVNSNYKVVSVLVNGVEVVEYVTESHTGWYIIPGEYVTGDIVFTTEPTT